MVLALPAEVQFPLLASSTPLFLLLLSSIIPPCVVLSLFSCRFKFPLHPFSCSSFFHLSSSSVISLCCCLRFHWIRSAFFVNLWVDYSVFIRASTGTFVTVLPHYIQLQKIVVYVSPGDRQALEEASALPSVERPYTYPSSYFVYMPRDEHFASAKVLFCLCW